jgi:hypothetical protein
LSAGQSSSTDGYTSGGAYWPPTPLTALDTIDSFPFTAPFVTATDAGNLFQTRSHTVGQSSSTEGFTSGGYAAAPPVLNTVDKFPFSSPFVTATDAGNLSQTVTFLGSVGQSSDTDGYRSGGNTGSNTDTIDKFPFSAPFVTATDAGNLTSARYGVSGQSSSTEGFASSGFNPGPAASTIDKFPFSSPFVTATDVGEVNVPVVNYGAGHSAQGASTNILLDTDTVPATYFSTSGTPGTNQYFGVGVSGLEYVPSSAEWQTPPHQGATYGYISGGIISPTYTDRVNRFPFTGPFTTATDLGELPAAQGWGAGYSSSTDGYVGGTYPPGENMLKFPFGAPPVTVTDIGELSYANANQGGPRGISSDTYGYTNYYQSPISPFVTGTGLQRFPFSSPPAFSSADVGEMTQPQYYDKTAPAASETKGYFTGGDYAGQITNNSIEFPFAAAPTTFSSAGTLSITPSGVGDAAAASSPTDGHTMGGYNLILTKHDIIQSYPFSAPFTISTDLGELAAAVNNNTGTSSISDGYSAGGELPGTTDRIEKFPFSSPFTTATDAGELNDSIGASSGHWL